MIYSDLFEFIQYSNIINSSLKSFILYLEKVKKIKNK